MNGTGFNRALALAAIVLLPVVAIAEEAPLPAVDGRPVIAEVNGEPVLLDDLAWQIAAAHMGMAAPADKVSRRDPAELLDRLIGIRLVLQEARAIGLHELPEIVDLLEGGRKEFLVEQLLDAHVESLPDPDPEAVDAIYKPLVQELQISSVVFETLESVNEMQTALGEGRDFGEVAAAMVDDGTAVEYRPAEFLKAADMLSHVRKIALDMERGEVSRMLRIEGKFTLFRLEGERFPEDPEARGRAEAQAFRRNANEAVRAYGQSLKAKHAKVDEELLQSLDFEAAEPGFDALTADERILAEIDGEEPYRVRDLAEALKRKFFHGMDRAAEAGRINDKKYDLLENVLVRRSILKEAAELGLDETPEYQAQVTRLEERALFGTFVRRVVDPEITLTDEALQAYYDEHIDDFMEPELIRLEGITFENREDARNALEKLRSGADMGWMLVNAPGRTTTEDDEIAAALSGNLILATVMPDAVRGAIAGADTGDFRFLERPDGPYRVIHVKQRFPAKPQPIESVRDHLVRGVFEERQKAGLDHFIAELRAASEIEVFASGERLNELVGMETP